jgi:hypothetical protein
MGLPVPRSRPQWHSLAQIESRAFTCGYCGREVGSDRGYYSERGVGLIYICHLCGRPTFFYYADQTPAPRIGGDVSHLPETLAVLYREARDCTSVAAYTAAVMLCRVILMNVAVSIGAPENRSFVQYVDYLWEQHYVPPNSRPWIDRIRSLGNTANHEIQLMGKTEAEEAITFVEMLLQLVFEFPARRHPTVHGGEDSLEQ